MSYNKEHGAYETSKCIFRNRNFKKREPDRTSIVYCIAETKPVTEDDRWVETDAMPSGLDLIHVANGVRYYGYL